MANAVNNKSQGYDYGKGETSEKSTNYDRVSDKQMKQNGFEPHDNKPSQGGKIDYYKNENGDLFYKTEKGNHYEPVFDNIKNYQ